MIPTKSIAVANLFEELFTFAIPSSNVRPASDSFMKVFDRPVPAIDPFSPLLARAPKRAPVSSNETPKALDVGAANLKDSFNELKFCAELIADEANTSTTRPVSFVSSPKERTTEPANSADSAKLTSNDAAKSKIEGVASPTSLAVKPNLANSVCNSTTCDAVKAVVAPNVFACVESVLSSSDVAPEIPFKEERDFPNLAPAEAALIIKATKEPRATTIAPIPEESKAALIPPSACLNLPPAITAEPPALSIDFPTLPTSLTDFLLSLFIPLNNSADFFFASAIFNFTAVSIVFFRFAIHLFGY